MGAGRAHVVVQAFGIGRSWAGRVDPVTTGLDEVRL